MKIYKYVVSLEICMSLMVPEMYGFNSADATGICVRSIIDILVTL